MTISALCWQGLRTIACVLLLANLCLAEDSKPIGHVVRKFQVKTKEPIIELDRPEGSPRFFASQTSYRAEVEFIDTIVTPQSLKVGSIIMIKDEARNTCVTGSILEFKQNQRAKAVAIIRVNTTQQGFAWIRVGVGVYLRTDSASIKLTKPTNHKSVAKAVVVQVAKDRRRLFLCQLRDCRQFQSGDTAFLLSDLGIWCARLKIESRSVMKLTATVVEQNAIFDELPLEGRVVVSNAPQSSANQSIESLKKLIERLSNQQTCLREMAKLNDESLERAKNCLLIKRVHKLRQAPKHKAVLIKKLGVEVIFCKNPAGALVTKTHDRTFSYFMGIRAGDFLMRANETNLDSEPAFRHCMNQEVIDFTGVRTQDTESLTNWTYVSAEARLKKR